ncbi:MAG: glycogen debranching enzyme GlgX, partial [Actinomycetota bacterium]|nr:glycogen debranching enzyme GlgX [Actinomycetota bacterium]
NRSWNCGVEGPTDDAAIEALRLRQAKNLLATLLLSTGVPMLTMGDELRRTQGGNNNAYVQDNEISWVSWDLGPDARELLDLTTRLIKVRREHPVFRQRAFFSGHDVSADGVKDVAWFGPSGSELVDDEWFDPSVQTLGMYLDGRGIRTRGPHGEPVVDESFLLLLHMGPEDTEVQLPGSPWASRYEIVLGTAETVLHETALQVLGRSVTLLRACR